MNRVNVYAVIVMIMSFSLTACNSAMKMVCRPGSKSIGCYSFSRGEGGPFAFETGKKLPTQKPAQSRSASGCVLTLQNKASQEVNVFVDTIFQGSLISGEKGYLSIDDDYDYIHVVSTDEQYKWLAEGGCEKDKALQVSEK